MTGQCIPQMSPDTSWKSQAVGNSCQTNTHRLFLQLKATVCVCEAHFSKGNNHSRRLAVRESEVLTSGADKSWLSANKYTVCLHLSTVSANYDDLPCNSPVCLGFVELNTNANIFSLDMCNNQRKQISPTLLCSLFTHIQGVNLLFLPLFSYSPFTWD